MQWLALRLSVMKQQADWEGETEKWRERERQKRETACCCYPTVIDAFFVVRSLHTFESDCRTLYHIVVKAEIMGFRLSAQGKVPHSKPYPSPKLCVCLCVGHNSLIEVFNQGPKIWPTTLEVEKMPFVSIPHSSATCWECWAVVSGHTPPSSSPPLRGRTAPGRSRAAGSPHGYLRTHFNTTHWTHSLRKGK